MAGSRKAMKLTISAHSISPKDRLFGDDTKAMPVFIKKLETLKIEPTTQTVDLKEHRPKERNPFTISNLQPGQYSFQIETEQIIRIANQLLSIVSDPFVIAELLKDIDEELSRRLPQEGSNSTQLEPTYLIAGRTHWIPGPPPNDYIPQNKHKLLDQLLLEREQKEGINKEGPTPIFVGLIERAMAITYMKEGHLFSEDVHSSVILLHGKYTHRLLFEAFRQAVKEKRLNLETGHGTQLTQAQLVELLVQTYDNKSNNLWDSIIDVTAVLDHRYEEKILENDNKLSSSESYKNSLFLPENYSYSCRSPFGMHSILLCFGSHLNLSHLQSYLLDSHYKVASMMAAKVSQTMKSLMSFETIYTGIMIALTATSLGYGVIAEENHAFTYVLFSRKSKYDVIRKPYARYSTNFIGKKKASTPHPNYSSRVEYTRKKAEKMARINFDAMKEYVIYDCNYDALLKENFPICYLMEHMNYYYTAQSIYRSGQTQHSVQDEKKHSDDSNLFNDIDDPKQKEFLENIHLILSNMAMASSKQDKQKAFINFLAQKKETLTLEEINLYFRLIKEMEDLNTHANPEIIDRFFGITLTASWQKTIKSTQEMAFQKLELELNDKSEAEQIIILTRAKEYSIFKTIAYNPDYLPSMFQHMRHGSVCDKIDMKLNALLGKTDTSSHSRCRRILKFIGL